jgi:DNA-binding NarL/FixJ family response regulator
VRRERREGSRRAPVRVVVAEGDFLAREGMGHIVRLLDGIELVAVYGDAEAPRAEIDHTSPDVVVTDVRLAPRYEDEGIRLAVELRETHPGIGVVLLGRNSDARKAVAIFAGGSARRAYLSVERLSDAAELGRAIRAVAAGSAFVDARVLADVISARRGRDPHGLTVLTTRERQILELIAEGHANRAIAARLGITVRGVERHVNSIFAKLHIGKSESVSPRVMAALLFLADAGRLNRGARA